MTLYQLKVWTIAAKHQSLTKAAGELHISQPSVWHHINLLKNEYRINLYKGSSGRKIQITREGKLFVKYAANVLLQVKKLDNKFKGKRKKKGKQK